MTNRKILVNCLKLCPIFSIYVIFGGVGEGEYLIFMFDWGECGLCKNNTKTYSGNLVWTDSEKTQKLKILFLSLSGRGRGLPQYKILPHCFRYSWNMPYIYTYMPQSSHWVLVEMIAEIAIFCEGQVGHKAICRLFSTTIHWKALVCQKYICTMLVMLDLQYLF